MTSIIVPTGSDVRLQYVRPDSFLAITPPGCSLTALESLGRPGAVAGLLSFDPNVRWPDSRDCVICSRLLNAGVPVALRFAKFDDALAARDRLMRGPVH